MACYSAILLADRLPMASRSFWFGSLPFRYENFRRSERLLARTPPPKATPRHVATGDHQPIERPYFCRISDTSTLIFTSWPTSTPPASAFQTMPKSSRFLLVVAVAPTRKLPYGAAVGALGPSRFGRAVNREVTGDAEFVALGLEGDGWESLHDQERRGSSCDRRVSRRAC